MSVTDSFNSPEHAMACLRRADAVFRAPCGRMALRPYPRDVLPQYAAGYLGFHIGWCHDDEGNTVLMEGAFDL